MPNNLRPAKKGSKEHNRRISEGLIDYYKKNPKRKKRSLIGSMIAKRFHPDNVKHRKTYNDPDLKKAKREKRKAEGELSSGVHKRLTPEKLAAIRQRLKEAQEREDRALDGAIKKHNHRD